MLRFLVVTGVAVAMSLASVRAQEQKESLGDKLKKLFSHPTPSPTPRRSHPRPSPSPSASFGDSGTVPTYGETPGPNAEPNASVQAMAPVETKIPETQYFEPVRPMNQVPRDRTPPKTIYALPQNAPSPNETPSPSVTPEITEEVNPEERPKPSLPPVTATRPQAPIPSEADIVESKEYPEDVRRLIDLSLDLAKKNLTYKYASADPASGGFDCSGFINYVFTKSGIKNVPRDAREQYVWVRKAGNFQAVLGHGDDTFELDALKPGDLLFWANPSGASREPEIAQTMIYIGRDKATNQRLMVGATEGSTYKGEKRNGVGVFDFKLGAADQNADEEPTSVFVGYGRFPDLSGN